MTLVDTASGAQLGNTVVLTGSQGGATPMAFSPNGSLLAASANGPSGAQVVVIDTATGTPVGPAATLTGSVSTPIKFAPATSRVIVFTGGGATSNVSVLDSTTGAQVGASVQVTGGVITSAVTSDGTRTTVIATTGTSTEITAVDLTSGVKVGSSTYGQVSTVPTFSADGTRVVLPVYYPDFGGVTQFYVVDATTGSALGQLFMTGSTDSQSVTLNSNGTRAAVATYLAGFNLTQVAVVNLTTGQQVGYSTYVTGQSRQTVFSADGSHVVFAVNDSANASTRAIVFNATTGSSTPVYSLDGGYVTGVKINSSGQRVVLSGVTNTGVYTTSTAVIDGDTGTQLGTTLVQNGSVSFDGLQLSPDGAIAAVLTYGNSGGTWLSFVRTANGLQLGDTLAFEGGTPFNPLRFDSDGTRATITTSPASGVRVTVVRLDGPVDSAPTVGTANAVTGVVAGTVNATDPNNGQLTYSVATQAAHGVVTLGTGGQFTYTPNVTARLAAAVSPGDDTDSFIISVTDSHGSSTRSKVVVPVGPTGAVNQVATSTSSPYIDVSPDGTRAALIESSYTSGGYASTITFIDTASGNVIGNRITLPVSNGGTRVSWAPNASRVFITTSTQDQNTGVTTYGGTVIDTATGNQIGNALTFSGIPTLSPDGGHIVAAATERVSGVWQTQVTVYDAATGAVVGSPIVQTGERIGATYATVFNTTGTRAYVSSIDSSQTRASRSSTWSAERACPR